jgi:hypothetical protein
LPEDEHQTIRNRLFAHLYPGIGAKGKSAEVSRLDPTNSTAELRPRLTTIVDVRALSA